MDVRGLLNRGLNYHVQGYKPASETMGLLSRLPGVGDAARLLGDAAMYAEDPSQLTPMSGLLSLAGVLPGVPSRAMWVDAVGSPIKNKLLRKALKSVRPEANLDDQILTLKQV